MSDASTAANATAPAEPRELIARDVDVAVVGGGPAGATIAALLAERGISVAVADKDHHPRFHIGESLLPMNLPLLDKLGVREEVDRVGMPKYAAEFVSPQHDGRLQQFEFGNAWDKSLPYAYQVRRADFDEILLRNARRKGAEVVEGCRVSAIDFRAAGDRHVVRGRADDGTDREWRAKFVVDATGRDTFLANRYKLKYKNPHHVSSALYGHFRNAKRNPGRDEGNITIYWFDHGWFWFIPLADGTTSVGAVCWPYYMRSRKTDVTTFFHETIALAPQLAERLRDAELIEPPTATGNYSYLSTKCHGDGYLLVGDAFAFLDPVFSSGVYLAMAGAFFAADTVETVLKEPARADAALAAYEKRIRHGLSEFSWFVYRMTTPSIRDLFMAPKNVMRIEEALLSLLAGDVWRNPEIPRRLRFFKGIYYAQNVLHPRRTLTAWRRRRRNLRSPGAVAEAA